MPLISVIDSIYVGEYTFLVIGANANTPDKISDAYEFTVILSFPENNAPVLVNPPS